MWRLSLMKNDMAFKMKWARDQGRAEGFKDGHEDGYQEGHVDGIKFAIEQYSGVVLLCLKDKFNFTSEQLQDVAWYINDTFDSVEKGYLSLEDIIQTLKEEDGLDVRFTNKGVIF